MIRKQKDPAQKKHQEQRDAKKQWRIRAAIPGESLQTLTEQDLEAVHGGLMLPLLLPAVQKIREP
jgi:hypothetical protein